MPVRMLKRALLVCAGWSGVAVIAVTVPAAAIARVPLGNWDAAQQREVVRAGLMSDLQGNDFGGAGRLRGAEADRALAALAQLADRDSPAPDGGPQTLPLVHAASGLVSVTAFDRLVIDQLGLADVAGHVQRATAAVGLRPPSYYGSEVVARFLGLRYDHPAGTDQLELFPWDPITRAETAWSLAQVMDDGSWSVQSARETLMAYSLPRMTADQLTALRSAVSKIGYPYVYAAPPTTPPTAWPMAALTARASCGACSRSRACPGAPRSAGAPRRRWRGEIPHHDRLRYHQLRPGDLLFFGSAHFNSTATEANVIHAGIYLGDNWVIHSSGQGVYVLPLRGSWLGDQLAWGRRVLP